MKKSKELSGIICAILSAVLFGTMPLMAKYAFGLGSNAFMVAFGRFITGAFFSGLFLCFSKKYTIRITPVQLRSIAILSFFFAATPCLLYASYQYIDSGLATTLHFTYPVVVMLLSIFVLKSNVSKRSLLCILICLIGIFCLYQPGGKTDLWGVLIAAASGVVYAGYITGVEKIGLKELPVLTIIFWLSLFSAAEVFLFSLVTKQLRFDLPWQVWIPYTGLGLVAMVIAASLFQIGIMRCGGVKSSLFSTIEPVTGVVIGVIAFQETLNGRSIIGIIMIILAVCILALPAHNKKMGTRFSATLPKSRKGNKV